jgi:tRNA dimethylallyltransferase
LSNKNLIVLVGPTAVGKTSVGIELARHFQTEIISSDSRQIYREMRIGTAVPSADELTAVKHHFIQTRTVKEYYNASMFEFDVLDKLNLLFKKYDTVLMVGGSTLYIDAVCYGIDDLPTVDFKLREELMQKYREEGMEYLRQQLRQLDPEHYNKVDLKNPNRMLKAIEVSLMTGKPYSAHLTAQRKSRDFNIIKLALNVQREELFSRINQRVDLMIAEGLEAEARSVQPLREYNALKTVGYREMFDYIDGAITLEEAVEQIKTNTRRYAKRQITWFNRDKEMPWFEPSQITEMVNFIKEKTKNSDY